MPNTLRIKRRTTGATGAPSTLANAELAFNEVNNTLYYGKGDNGSGVATSIIAIAGDGTFATKSYVDTAVSNATPTGVAYLAQDNTWDATKTNTFNGTVNLEGAFQIDAVAVLTSAAELNVLDGALSNTVVNSKAVIYGAAGEVAASTISTTGNGTVGGNLTVTGNLTVNGTTTTVNSTVVTIDDPIFTLGGDTAPGADDNKDRGVAFQWHNGTAAKVGFFGYDDSASAFTFVPDATISGEVVSGTVGDLIVGRVNNVTFTTPASAATLTLGSGKTVTVSNTLTFTGTDSSSVAFGAGGTVAYTGNTLAVFAATTSSQLAGVISDETGSGSLVFATSPVLTTPNIGTPSAGTLTNCTGLPVNTGISGFAAGVVDFLTSGSSAKLAGAINDETGSGSLVFGTSPTITTPAITFSTSATVTAGTNAQGQGALTNDMNLVTTAANSPSGVTLPSATVGRRLVVANRGANAVNVYPATGATIDALAANAAIQIPVGGQIEFNATSTTQWYSSATSTFTAPTLGTPASGTLTNCTGLPVSTGISGLGTNVATFLATPSSANLISAITDETGTGTLVFSNSPVLTTPTLGVASATSINKVAITAPATAATLTIADGKTITVSNTLTFTGTDSSSVAFGSGGTVAYTGNTLAAFAATTSSQLAGVISDETGSGSLVFATSPVLTTPNIGTPSAGTLTNCTGLPISTGVSGLGTGVATFLATPSSANLASAVTDETGSGSLVFGTSPAFTTSVTTGSATFAVFNTTATTVNAFGAATTLSMGASSGTTTINNDLTVTGNLTINGTTTTVNSTTMTVDDPIVTLGGDTAPASDDNKDRGVEFRWHNGTAARVGFFGYDDSTGKFTFIPDATNTSEVFSGTLGTIDVGAVHINGTAFGVSNLGGLGTNVGTFLATPSSANLAAAITDETGSGSLVFATSPVLTTPNIGTPSAGTLTNCTGLPISTGVSGLGTGVATALAVNTGSAGAVVLFNGALGTPASGTLTNCTGLPVSTGISGLAANVATFLATPSSANLASALTDKTGTGANVFANSPTLVAPALGTPSSGTLTSCTGLPISTGVSGLGTGVATFLATPSSANLAAAITDETGTGSLVFATSPALAGTPTAPTAAVDTNTTQVATTAFVIGQGYLKTANVCSAIADCTLDGGTF